MATVEESKYSHGRNSAIDEARLNVIGGEWQQHEVMKKMMERGVRQMAEDCQMANGKW